MNELNIKRGDTVVIVSGAHSYKNTKKEGKDAKGKALYKPAKVIEVSPKEKKVIIEGKNFVTKHVKPKKQGEPGGIVKAEAPIYACKVMVYCDKCERPVRTGYKMLEDGSKIRVCKKCGSEIPVSNTRR